MAVSGAVMAGAATPAQADGPRLLYWSSASELSVPPTANASGRLAGLKTEPAVGPSLPAANTGTMPAARRLRRSFWNSESHPVTAIVHELLTTFGASGVAGLPSGSSSHCRAR